MVLLHVKRSEQQQFLFETTVETYVKDVVRDIATIHNMRQCITKLQMEGGELALYGPAKPTEKHGIDTYAEGGVEQGPFYKMDPTGRRTGNACDPKQAEVLTRVLDEAAEVASHKQVERKVPLTVKMLQDKLDEIKGAVMICYPMGLPAWDPMRLIADGDDGGCASYGTDDLEVSTCSLWFAGKQMLNDNKLSAHIGKNEKSKVIVKLQKKGQGAPSREPAVDKDTQKAMMAWYHKQQETQKQLTEDQDDSYIQSPWASGNSLKAHFSGVSNVRLPR